MCCSFILLFTTLSNLSNASTLVYDFLWLLLLQWSATCPFLGDLPVATVYRSVQPVFSSSSMKICENLLIVIASLTKLVLLMHYNFQSCQKKYSHSLRQLYIYAHENELQPLLITAQLQFKRNGKNEMSYTFHAHGHFQQVLFRQT